MRLQGNHAGPILCSLVAVCCMLGPLPLDGGMVALQHVMSRLGGWMALCAGVISPPACSLSNVCPVKTFIQSQHEALAPWTSVQTAE